MSNSFTGQIILTGFSKAMVNWALCQGQALRIADYQALFSVIGTIYGGDGVTTFNLPNLSGSLPIGAGTGTAPGATAHPLGSRGGSESITLTAAQVPAHTHSLNATSATSTTPTLAAGVVYGSDPTNAHKHYENPVPSPINAIALYSGSVSSAGGGNSHPNIMPTIGLAYQICLNGLYPVNQ
ncbi:MAG: tail fiber protein [Sphingomonas sp.]|jgi:microcystin-dependent protein|uniref:phage tail protein n=1 Tax=Sphingomonas sp. TaxID=28214 RepID=UPI003565E18B